MPQILDKDWKPYLEGKIDMATAIRRILSDYGIDPPTKPGPEAFLGLIVGGAELPRAAGTGGAPRLLEDAVRNQRIRRVKAEDRPLTLLSCQQKGVRRHFGLAAAVNESCIMSNRAQNPMVAPSGR